MTEPLPFHFSLSCIGEGNGNPLQCSCLENPRDRGASWAAIYGVAQSRTQLKWLSSSSSSYLMPCICWGNALFWIDLIQDQCKVLLICFRMGNGLGGFVKFCVWVKQVKTIMQSPGRKMQTSPHFWSLIHFPQAALVTQTVQKSVCSAEDPGLIPGQEDPLKKTMATHSSVLAWRMLWTEGPGGLQSMGCRVTKPPLPSSVSLMHKELQLHRRVPGPQKAGWLSHNTHVQPRLPTGRVGYALTSLSWGHSACHATGTMHAYEGHTSEAGNVTWT